MAWDAVKEVKRRLSFEEGTLFKDWGGRIPVAHIYPNSYYLGMCSLGFQTVYRLINDDEHFVCERVFWEEPGMRYGGTSPIPLISIESQRPLQDFAVLSFTLSYEQDYFNIPKVLRAAKIPLYAKERDDTHPLILGGGPCTLINPEPVAPFFDAFAMGEGEVTLPGMLDAIHGGLDGNRQALLDALAKIPGVYVPSRASQGQVTKQYLKQVDDYPTHTVILTRETALSNIYIIETSRGCTRGCRFCAVGYVLRPMRHRSKEVILEQAREGLERTKRIGLLGIAVADHPELDDIVTRLKEWGAELSISSLRVDNLSDAVLSALSQTGAQNVTLAPEAGSENLRRVINKGVDEEDILRAFEKVAAYNIAQLKLYFMLGLPEERDEDAQAMVDLVSRGREIIQAHKARTKIALNVSPFVPKPGTAFQWVPMTRPEIIRRRLEMVRRGLIGKAEVRSDSPEWSEVQTVLSRAGRELAPVLERADGRSLSSWRRALRDCQIDPDRYVYRRWEAQETLPWDIIKTGVSKKFLALELARSAR